MTMMTKILAGGAGLAALAAAAPAAAQYYPYAQPYAQPYGYGYANPYAANATNMATQRCTAAVQQRLNANASSGGGIIGAILGVRTQAQGRVLSVTQVTPRSNTIRVRGLATSGRMAYNPYGVGAYGSVGYAYQPDLSFSCSVDYQGFIRDVDINRR